MHSKPNDYVVRDRGYGSGKHHIPTDDSLTETLCGVKPSSVGSFAHRGERAAFDEHCPDRICKRCRKVEERQLTVRDVRGELEKLHHPGQVADICGIEVKREAFRYRIAGQFAYGIADATQFIEELAAGIGSEEAS